MNRKKNRPGFRRCHKCNSEKPLTHENFNKDKNRHLGFMYKCRECEKDRKDRRVHRYVNMTAEQKLRAKERNWVYTQTEKGRSIALSSQYKKIDKQKGQENNITKEDIFKARNSLCTYCGWPASGLDRIDNSKGHTKENCVPCCKECNVARMDNFTHEEMEHIGETIRLIKAGREYKEFGNCVL